ncbi:aminopeptidase N-like [Harpegnathos saltator]|uniref:aminopeptidase N-like n=1 Tax=Harpegnathos saltator TaxID=610380 RepID=UPI00058E527A|nr:aminopeptidase N-like [Harpegnathos saltator]
MIIRTIIKAVFVILSFHADLTFTSEFTKIMGVELCRNEEFTYRLHTIIVPKHYNISLKLDVPSLEGQMNTTIQITKKTRMIAMHVIDLDIDVRSILIMLNKPNTHEIDRPLTIIHCPEIMSVVLILDNIICPGTYYLSMAYRSPTHERKGFFTIKDEKEKNNEILSYVTTFEPRKGAQYLFPCWDEPRLKATFNISIEHSAIYKVFSNMEEEKIVKIGKDTKRTILKSTPVMSTYLLTIVLTKLKYSYYPEEEIWFSYTPNNETLELVKVINFLTDYFFVQYTQKYSDNSKLKKLNMKNSTIVAVPGLPLKAMGAWQNIFLRKSDLLYDKSVDFPGRVLDIWKTISYGKTRQYIQSFVSPNHWSHMWFSRALALYLSYNVLGKGFNKEQMMQLFVVQVQLPAMHNDIVLKVPPILSTDDPIYSTLIYKKASVLLRMLEHIVSKDIFQKAFAEYLYTYAYQAATPHDFFTIMNKLRATSPVIKKIIKEMSKTLDRKRRMIEKDDNEIIDIMFIWMSKKYYPVLTVEGCNGSKELYVTYNEVKQVLTPSDKWPVPVTYTTQGKHRFNQPASIQWLNNHYTGWNSFLELTLDNVTEWVILNLQQIGYYRVQYDNRNWLRIARFLKKDKQKTIHVLSRVQLIDDAYYFLIQGTIDYKVYCELIDFLRNEIDFIVWHSMMNVLHYISPFFKFPESTDFKDLIMDIMDDVLMQIEYNEKTADDNMIKATRLLLLNWMCNHGHNKCRQAASNKLRPYIKNAVESPISPGWKNWVYCAGLMNADYELRMLAKDEILNKKDKNMLQYMTCYDNDVWIQELLTWIMFKPRDEKLSLDDRQEMDLYRTIVKKHARKSNVLDFILKNMTQILPGNMTALEKLGNVIMSIYSCCHFQKIMKYINSNVDSGGEMHEAKRILTNQVIQISKHKYMFLGRFPYNAEAEEC